MPENKIQITLEAINNFKPVFDELQSAVKSLAGNVNEQMKGVGKGIDDVSKSSSSGFMGGIKSIQTAIGLLTANAIVQLAQMGMGLVTTIRDFEILGARANAVADSFDRITQASGISGNQLVADIKKASNVFVDETDTMIKAQQLLIEGFSSEQIVKITEFARLLSQKAAIPVEEAFDRVVTAIMTGYTRGIRAAFPMEQADVFDQYARSIGNVGANLSQSGRQQAMFNEMFRMLISYYEKFGPLADTQYEKLQRQASAWGAIKSATAEALVNLDAWIAKTAGREDTSAQLVEAYISALQKVGLLSKQISQIGATGTWEAAGQPPKGQPGFDPLLAAKIARETNQARLEIEAKGAADREKLVQAEYEHEKEIAVAEALIAGTEVDSIERDWAIKTAAAKAAIAMDSLKKERQYEESQLKEKGINLNDKALQDALNARYGERQKAAVEEYYATVMKIDNAYTKQVVDNTKNLQVELLKLVDPELAARAEFDKLLDSLGYYSKTISPQARSEIERLIAAWEALHLEQGKLAIDQAEVNRRTSENSERTQTALAELDAAYERGTVTITDYYVRKDAIQRKSTDEAVNILETERQRILLESDSLERTAKLTENQTKMDALRQQGQRQGIQNTLDEDKATRDLAKTSADWTAKLGETTGSWDKMLTGQRQVLEAQRQIDLATKGTDSDTKNVINDYYDLKEAELQAQRTMNVPALMDIGIRKATIQANQDLAMQFENLIPNAIRTGTDAVSNFFQNLTSGTMSAKDALKNLAKDFVNNIEKMITNVVMLIAQMEILKALGKEQTTTTGGGGVSIGSLGGGFIGALLGTPSTAPPAGYMSFGAGINELPTMGGAMHGGRGPGEPPTFYEILPSFPLAKRFHEGIGPDELPAIIRKDESVLTPGQMKALTPVGSQRPIQIIMNIQTPNADSFRNSQDQITGKLLDRIKKGMRNR